MYRDIFICIRKDTVHVFSTFILDSIKQSHSRVSSPDNKMKEPWSSKYHALCILRFWNKMPHTSKDHRVIVQRADLSGRPAISRDQSTCVSVIPSTPITSMKCGVKFCAGTLVVVILFLAFLLSPTNRVAPVYNYPLRRGRTTIDVTQTTLLTPHPPNLPVVIRIIPPTVHPIYRLVPMG